MNSLRLSALVVSLTLVALNPVQAQGVANPPQARPHVAPKATIQFDTHRPSGPTNVKLAVYHAEPLQSIGALSGQSYRQPRASLPSGVYSETIYPLVSVPVSDK